MSDAGGRWLLIGNSRWHWAEGPLHARRYWSEPPGQGPWLPPHCWAAVGPVPAAVLDPAKRITLERIPLADAPAWLGIDRALAGWQAWRCSTGPVLVADAGTALSLTWIDRSGRFAGGRLLAGAALQLQALHAGTLALPSLQVPAIGQAAGGWPADEWPIQTEAAMTVGVLDGLAAALQRAAARLAQREPGLQLWLTGGDGANLQALLQGWPDPDQVWNLAPGLCLDGLAAAAALS